MDLVSLAFPAGWQIAGFLVALPILGAALYRAPWLRFAVSEPVHVWYGTSFCIIVLWSVRATVGEGFTFHLLGMAAFTLLAGVPLALVGGAIVLAVSIAVGGGAWANAGIAYAVMVAVPVASVSIVLRFAERRLPPNFFIYVFVGAFFGAAVSLAMEGLAGAILLSAGAGLPAGLVFGEYVPYLVYLAFGEATLTGMILTLAVVYRPQWVASFDDARYIANR
jgi:uncharacterized membrane protein